MAAALGPEAMPRAEVHFAHNSERQFAMLLDFYAIEWEYEPHMFVLREDDLGHPLEAFSPDFYLPAFDLHIEITTQRQKLVTKKNAKARKLRERHPEVRVKILYQRDYLHLLVKYGLEEPSQLVGSLRPTDTRTTSAEAAESLLGLGPLSPPGRVA